MPKYHQSIVNAQMEINRAVWASNLQLKKEDPNLSFKNDKEKEQYIIKCCQEAIKDLKNYLKIVENTLF